MKIRQKNTFFSSYGSIAALIFIWVFAFLLSSPLFFFNIHKTSSLNLGSNEFSPTNDANYDSITFNNNTNMTNTMDDWLRSSTSSGVTSLHLDGEDAINQDELEEEFYKLMSVSHCIENSPFHQSRLIYSYASLLIQYMLPFLIVGIAYGSIWWKLTSHRNKLKSHNVNSTPLHQQQAKDETKKNQIVASTNGTAPVSSRVVNSSHPIERKNTLKHSHEKSKRLKMNILLAFIAIIFAASWLPLNIFNILSDSSANLKVTHSYYLINAICILLGMSSAVSNPFLYGFLNENFKREYVKLFSNIYHKIASICGAKTNPGSNTPNTPNNNINKRNTDANNNRTINDKNQNTTVFNNNINVDVTKVTEKVKKELKLSHKNRNQNHKKNVMANLGENKKLIKSGPVILINSESINDNSL